MRTDAKGIEGYHERTKHQPRRFARSAGYLDWESEPAPFRRYEGAPLFRLPLANRDPEGTYADLFDGTRSVPHPFSSDAVACFLELSLGLSAWKTYENNSWALRMNPSSGNLHPVEAYLVLPPLPDLPGSGGIYHYNPYAHGIEARATFDDTFWPQVRQLLPEGFFAALSTIHWREAWKYGERAFRYSHLDVGHAMAAMSFSAALLGWRVSCLSCLSDRDVETILGFAKTSWKEFEGEEAGPLFYVHASGEEDLPQGLPDEIIRLFAPLTFTGEPNQLSRRHRNWEVIDEASRFTIKPRTPAEPFRSEERPFLASSPSPVSGARVIRKRRSATAFDGHTSLEKEHFFDILDRTLPRADHAPFGGACGPPLVHLLVFVHRVDNLEPGLYFLLRGKDDQGELKKDFRAGFLWEKTPADPGALPLYLLERGDFTQTAQAASCNQEIASDGAFAIAMIAEFRAVREKGPYWYRLLHWEAGMIGQVLYLACEVHGMRGTGMGCFFDDTVHDLLGLRDNAYQDLYHFGAGKPVEDSRIATLPPYHHLNKS